MYLNKRLKKFLFLFFLLFSSVLVAGKKVRFSDVFICSLCQREYRTPQGLYNHQDHKDHKPPYRVPKLSLEKAAEAHKATNKKGL